RIPGIFSNIAPPPTKKPITAAIEDIQDDLTVFQMMRPKQSIPALVTAINRTARSILLKKPSPAKKAARNAYGKRRFRHQMTMKKNAAHRQTKLGTATPQ